MMTEEEQRIVNAARELLNAIKDNQEPIEGTTGITQGDEVATGSYIRQQYISEEMDELESALNELTPEG